MQYGSYPEQAAALARLEGELERSPVRGAVPLPLRRLRRAVLPVLLRLGEEGASGQHLRQLVGRRRRPEGRAPALREPVCKTCNLDPLNKLTEEIRAEAAGQVPSGIERLRLDRQGDRAAWPGGAVRSPSPTRTSARPAGTSRSPPSEKGSTVQFVIDMEVTNRCNAKCHFCPRDRTPHQGLMPAEVFEAGCSERVLLGHRRAGGGHGPRQPVRAG